MNNAPRLLHFIVMMIVGGCLMSTSLVAVTADHKRLDLTFACAANNDLYATVSRSGCRCSRYKTPAEAIEKAPPSSGVLLLADGYPTSRLLVGPELIQRAADKHLRLYIEYPEGFPGQPLGP